MQYIAYSRCVQNLFVLQYYFTYVYKHSTSHHMRMRMSFIEQVCLHIQGIYYTKAPQCNRRTAKGQDTDDKRIYKYTNRQCTK